MGHSLKQGRRHWTVALSGCHLAHEITLPLPKVFFRGITVNMVRGFPMSAAMFLGYELSLKAFRRDHGVPSP